MFWKIEDRRLIARTVQDDEAGASCGAPAFALRRLLLAKTAANNHLPGMTICPICKRLVLTSYFCAALAAGTAEIIGSLSEYPAESYCSVSSPCAVERGLPPPWSPDNPDGRPDEGPAGTPLTLAAGSGPTGTTWIGPPPTGTTGSGPTGPTGPTGVQSVRPLLATGPNGWREVT
jgi:hypothetical protein